MELVKCPICGEMYSESYKACPFCAESGPYEGTVKRRKGTGRRVERRKNPKILGPAMILVLLLLAAVLVFAFFGDQIKAKLYPDSGEKTPVEEVQLTVEPATVELAVGEIRALTASGGDGYVWSSSDEAVATVDEQGSVTAVGEGSAVITVTDKDGELSAHCEVTVGETAVEPVEPGTDDPTPVEPGTDDPTPVEPGTDDPTPVEPGTDDPAPDDPGTDDPTPDDPGTDEPVEPTPAKDLSICYRTWNGSGKELSKIYDADIGESVYDLTLYASSGSLTLFVYGTDSTVTWSSSSSAVTVSSNGTLNRVGSGKAYITAKVDGQTLKCRVLG